jgi:hypothetical protein
MPGMPRGIRHEVQEIPQITSTGPAEVWVGLLLVVLVRPDDGLCARD